MSPACARVPATTDHYTEPPRGRAEVSGSLGNFFPQKDPRGSCEITKLGQFSLGESTCQRPRPKTLSSWRPSPELLVYGGLLWGNRGFLLQRHRKFPRGFGRTRWRRTENHQGQNAEGNPERGESKKLHQPAVSLHVGQFQGERKQEHWTAGIWAGSMRPSFPRVLTSGPASTAAGWLRQASAPSPAAATGRSLPPLISAATLPFSACPKSSAASGRVR